jgi:hypothetical protein
MLLKDERCDQESAQHKEEVDPEGSIRRPVRRMEANYDRDGDAANTVERRFIAKATYSRIARGGAPRFNGPLG